MKKYFEKHQSLIKHNQHNQPEQTNSQQTNNTQRHELAPLHTILKPNKTNSFFKSKDTSKLISNLKLT